MIRVSRQVMVAGTPKHEIGVRRMVSPEKDVFFLLCFSNTPCRLSLIDDTLGARPTRLKGRKLA